MSKLVRMISAEGDLTVIAADTTDIVARAEQIHKTSAVTSAALGRLLTAASTTSASITIACSFVSGGLPSYWKSSLFTCASFSSASA